MREIVPTPSAKQWQAAAAKLAKGEAELMVELLRALDKPIVLAECFAIALEEAAALQATIDARPPASATAMRETLAALRRAHPATLEDAERIGGQVVELERQILDHDRATNEADNASRALQGLRWYLPELFGETPQRAAGLPTPRVANWISERFGHVPRRWTDIERPRVAERPRRKIRAGSFAPRNPQGD